MTREKSSSSCILVKKDLIRCEDYLSYQVLSQVLIFLEGEGSSFKRDAFFSFFHKRKRKQFYPFYTKKKKEKKLKHRPIQVCPIQICVNHVGEVSKHRNALTNREDANCFRLHLVRTKTIKIFRNARTFNVSYIKNRFCSSNQLHFSRQLSN